MRHLPPYEAIETLKKYPHWTGCKYPDKTLLNPHSGGQGQSTNPGTQGTYEQAFSRGDDDHWTHLGFALHPKVTDVMLVDFDDCVKGGVIDPEVWEMVKTLNSYAEFSPSGEGIHVLCQGVLPANIGAYKPDLAGLDNPPAVPTICEMYDHGRWFTMTGLHVKGCPTAIQPRYREVIELHKEISGRIERHKKAIKALRNPVKVSANGTGSNKAYAKAAFSDEIQTLRATALHGRNTQLFNSACNLLEFVNAGELVESEVVSELTAAAEATGLDQAEIEKALRSAKKRVGDKKREIPEADYTAPVNGNGNGHGPAEPKEETKDTRAGFGENGNGTGSHSGEEIPKGEPAAADSQAGEEPAPPVFKPLTLAELMQQPPKEWLVDNLIGRGDIAMVFGDAGSGKTFIAIDLILAAALGRQFAARFPIKQPLKVAYCAGEGIAGLPNRFAAAINKWHVSPSDLTLTIYTDVPQLFDEQAEKSIYTFVRELSERCEQINLLVIDTLHSAATGADENHARDTGRILDAAKYARSALGCTVLLIHHANRAGAYRGSSALHGAMDAMLQTRSADNVGILECFKQKDAERFTPLYFRLTKEPVSQSVYVEWLEAHTVKLNDEPKAPDKAKEAIRDLLTQKPNLNQSEIVAALAEEVGRHSIRQALAEMEQDQELEVVTQGKKKVYQMRLFE